MVSKREGPGFEDGRVIGLVLGLTAVVPCEGHLVLVVDLAEREGEEWEAGSEGVL